MINSLGVKNGYKFKNVVLEPIQKYRLNENNNLVIQKRDLFNKDVSKEYLEEIVDGKRNYDQKKNSKIKNIQIKKIKNPAKKMNRIQTIEN